MLLPGQVVVGRLDGEHALVVAIHPEHRTVDILPMASGGVVTDVPSDSLEFYADQRKRFGSVRQRKAAVEAVRLGAETAVKDGWIGTLDVPVIVQQVERAEVWP